MTKKRSRRKKSNAKKQNGFVLPSDGNVIPDHEKSAFLIVEPNCFILHRLGPARGNEKIYGPYMDKHKAVSKLSEYVEHFVRENHAFDPQLVFKQGVHAKISVLNASGEGRSEIFYAVKPVGY